MAETPTIQSMARILAPKWYNSDESDSAQDIPLADVKRLKQMEGDLAWMRAREGNAEPLPDDEVVERLAGILSWNGRGGLHTLELAARFVIGPGRFSKPLARRTASEDRQALWVRASQVYRLAMTALAHSSAAIPNLYIYSRTIGCSVPSYDITVGLPSLVDSGLRTAGASVETLDLSFSTRVDHGWRGWEQAYGAEADRQERATQRRQWTWVMEEDEYAMAYGGYAEVEEEVEERRKDGEEDRDDESDEDFDDMAESEAGSRIRGRYRDDYPAVVCRANFPGIADLLRNMPNLQALDLHMYQTLEYELDPGVSRLHHQYHIFGALVSRRVSLPRLKRLSLRGLVVDALDLVPF